MIQLSSVYHQAKPILPKLPNSVIHINIDFQPDSFITWFTGTVYPAGKQVLISLTNKEYDSIIETVRSGNGASQALLLDQLFNFSNDPEITPKTCTVIEDLSEIHSAKTIAELLLNNNVVKGINDNFINKSSMNVCWTNNVTHEDRWTPIWASNNFLIALFAHPEHAQTNETQCDWLAKQLLTPKNHFAFNPSTISLYDAIKDELQGWTLTEFTFAHADTHEHRFRKIIQ